jgi:hypothetical protein
MTEAGPIPNDLRKAFCRAVIELKGWSPPAPEPMVRYGRKVPVSVICEFVGHYAPDKMPEELVEMILRLLKPDPNHPMLVDRTFQGGARCVIELIEQRRMTGRSHNE